MHERRAVKKVIATSNSNPWRFITALKFIDKDEEEICSYNPHERNDPILEQTMREDEEIFGVFGVMGKCSYLTTFGFIVKIREA